VYVQLSCNGDNNAILMGELTLLYSLSLGQNAREKKKQGVLGGEVSRV